MATKSKQSVSDRPLPLSRSASTASSHGHLRPKSRGSTASLQSVGVGNSFQPVQPAPPQHAPIDQAAYFIPTPEQQQQPFPQNVEDPNLMAYQHHMHHMRQPRMGDQPQQHTPILPHHDMRPVSQHGYAMQPVPMPYVDSMSQYGVQAQHMHHMRHASEQYEGSPAPEDSNNENGPSKRRKGTASTLANDQELRLLLQQYQGRSLRDVATEVQKNEGSGGKSEKAKQIFAMLWLQESCVRSSNSVRRDKVFARYTERCGNERVPTLNPASFGKLVRIIFPNVQTRRLGVRGESKYHYVDLSLVPTDTDPNLETFDRPGTSSGSILDRPASSASMSKSFQMHTRPMSLDVLPPRMSMETADFPAPIITETPTTIQEDNKRRSGPSAHKLDCRYINTPFIRVLERSNHTAQGLINKLPSVRPNMPATLSTYLAMPSTSTLRQPIPSSQESPIELPDIHAYLTGENYDQHLAKLLHDLYRSYSIDVIDAFLKCKDKSFFNHHSAFNGKMTVPVSKLFNLPCLAPWIQECDMRMYQQILRYMTPLVLQDVPEQVWNSFDRISQKLVGCLITSFEEKCPPHVVAAKIMPAARFANLLKKLRSAQAATFQVNRMLEHPQSRTQMWLDLCSVLDPEHIVQECVPPPESVQAVQAILRYDMRALLAPEPDPLVNAAEQDSTSLYARFFQSPHSVPGFLPASEASSELISRLVAWLERLPEGFEGHHPQCLLDWQTRFFRAIMNQFGTGGAMSYQSWWYLENFCHQMLSFMTELEGLKLSTDEQRLLDQREQEKRAEIVSLRGDDLITAEGKRKRATTDVGNEARIKSPTLSRPQTAGGDTEPEPDSAVSATFPHNTQSLARPQVRTLLTPTTELPPPQPTSARPDPDKMAPPPLPTHIDVDVDDDDDDMAAINQGGPLDLPSFRTGFTSPVKGGDDVRRASGLHDDSGIGMGIDEEHEHSHEMDALEAEKEAKKFNKRDWFLSSDPVEPGQGVGHVGVSVQ